MKTRIKRINGYNKCLIGISELQNEEIDIKYPKTDQLGIVQY